MKPHSRVTAPSFLVILLLACGEASESQILLDTISVLPAGPGIMHVRVNAPAIPWTMNFLEIDLRNPHISIETAKANDRLAGYERTSSMVSRRTFPGHRVVGGVNGDFYGGGGVPINIQVAQGQMLRTPIGTSAFGIGAPSRPFIRILGLSSSVHRGSTSRPINGVNQARGTDQLIVYNSYNGASTGTNIYGAEALVRPVEPWIVNDTVRCVVESVVNNAGNMAIPAGLAVLSGHGAAQSWIVNTLHSSDTVRLFMGVSPAFRRITEAIGGFPKIVAGGLDYVDQGFQEEGGPSHTYERHPRTAVGFTADSTRLVFFTVDGRQPSSAGMTLHEVAAMLIRWGVAHAVNFDGGGSTTMVVNGVITNSPSDGSERAVANALLAVSSAPIDTLSGLILNPRARRIYHGDSFRYTVSGIDRYGNPRPLDPGLIRYSVASRLGTIDSTGLFVSAAGVDSGWITVAHGSLRDSSFVVLKGIGQIVLEPRRPVTDRTRVLQFRPRAFDWDGLARTPPNNAYAWTSTDPAVGTVDSLGVFRGNAAGETRVIASLESRVDTAVVTVEIGSGTMTLDSLERLSGWALTGVNIDTSASSLSLVPGGTAGANCFRVFYRFTYDPAQTNAVRLDTDLPLFGIPDTLVADFKPDSTSHRVIFWFEDENGEQFRLYSSRFVSVMAGFDSLKTIMQNFIPVASGSVLNWPLRLRRVEIQLGSSRVPGAVYAGSILVDNIRVRYAGSSSSVQGLSSLPQAVMLEQNYPNPFNSETVIRFSVPRAMHVRLAIFDLLGRVSATLLDEPVSAGMHTSRWNARGASSGVYFARLDAGGVTVARRLLLLR